MVKKVLKVIVNIFTIFVFVMLAITIFAKVNMVISGKPYFDVFGYSVFKITTGSMSPAIKENDIIVVKNGDDFKEKDVVTYMSDNAFITHRVLSINADKVITKGDANNTSDKEIDKDAIIGKVVKTFPKLGVWQAILTTPKIIAAMFVTLLLFDFALSYKGKKETKKEKEDDIDKMFDEKADVNNKLKEALKEKIKEEEEVPYTVRLDIEKIQENINSNLKKKK